MEKLSSGQIEEITKIGTNVRAFLPYVKIQEPGELRKDYEIWENIDDFFHQLETEPLIDLIKSKQIGISWALAIWAVWLDYTIPGWSVLEFSQGAVEAQSLLGKSRVIYNNLPDWLKIFNVNPNSTEAFGFESLKDGTPWKSRIRSYPSTETAGIGETAGLVIHDESEFHEFYEVNLSHTRATVGDIKGAQLVSVSTVDKTKPDSYFKNHWKKAKAGKNGFKALFYDCLVRPDRDEEWYQKLVKENEDTPWVVEGNYPRTIEEALSPISTQSCFKKEVLEKLWADTRDSEETREGFIHIFHPPQVGTKYLAGIDVGEGVGLDYSVMTIVGRRGLQAEVAAVIYSNTVGTDSFAYECDKLGREYYNCLINFDNIGIGKAVADKLVALGYPNLYHSMKKGKMGDKLSEKPGWAMTQPVKRELTVKLIELVNNSSLLTRFRPMVKEMTEYQWVKGNPQPTGSTHGDTITALQLVVAVWDEALGEIKARLYVGGKQVW